MFRLISRHLSTNWPISFDCLDDIISAIGRSTFCCYTAFGMFRLLSECFGYSSITYDLSELCASILPSIRPLRVCVDAFPPTENERMSSLLPSLQPPYTVTIITTYMYLSSRRIVEMDNHTIWSKCGPIGGFIRKYCSHIRSSIVPV